MRIINFNLENNEKAFTLVEVLIAMLILTLMIFAFTPLFLGSIERIYFAGDKSEALYESQADLEVDIARRTIGSDSDYKLVFTFGENGTVVTIPGGLIDSEVAINDATAWLRGFVPFIPTIILDPSQLTEGYEDSIVKVTGRDIEDYDGIDFKSGNLYLYTQQGIFVDMYSPLTVTDTSAEFDLRIGLKNSESPYLATMNWSLTGGIEVTAYERLHINLPDALAVGSGQSLLISPDAEVIWKNRPHTAIGSGTFSDVIWTGFEYLAVSSSKNVVEWRDREEPVSIYSATQPLNALSYGSGKYVVVGDNGLIITSDNRTQWTPATVPVDTGRLIDIDWNGLKFVAVGDNGLILSSEYGSVWQKETVELASEVTFTGVAYGGGKWLAVGEQNGVGVIYDYKLIDNVYVWSKITYAAEPPPGFFTDVAIDGNLFIITGKGNVVLISTDGGTSWAFESPGTPGSTVNLNAVEWGIIGDSKIYIIVGDSGLLYTSNTGGIGSWVLQETSSTNNLMGVALRWVN